MERHSARLAAILLLGTSMVGCSTLGSSPKAAAASTDAAKPQPAKSLAADMSTQIQQAQLLRSSGDYAGATRILSQLMLIAPDDARIVGEYGKNLVQQGRSKEALDFLKRAVQLQPGDWSLYSATGVAYDQQGDYANAKLAYQQALALKPGDPGVLNNYALSRMVAGDLSGARPLMAQASSAGGSDPKIVRNASLMASLTPPTPAAAAIVQSPIKAAPKSAKPEPQGRPAALVAPKAGVVMQQLPAATTPTPVKTASRAPRKLVVQATDTKKPATPTKAKSTPALRMTADAATP